MRLILLTAVLLRSISMASDCFSAVNELHAHVLCLGKMHYQAAKASVVAGSREDMPDVQAAGLMDFIAAAPPLAATACAQANRAAGSAAFPSSVSQLNVPADPSASSSTAVHASCHWMLPESSTTNSLNSTPRADIGSGGTCISQPSSSSSSAADHEPCASYAAPSPPYPAEDEVPITCTSATAAACGPVHTAAAASHSAASLAAAFPEISSTRKCQKLVATRTGRRRGSRKDRRKRGLTPDHMLYWLQHMRSLEPDDQAHMISMQGKSTQPIAVKS